MAFVDTEECIRRALLVHGNRYGYSRTVFVNTTTKIEIECFKHGFFLQNPRNHWKGFNCPKCGAEKRRELLQSNMEDFVKSAIATHGRKYDYPPQKYINRYKKVRIICKEHGEFLQSPSDHLAGKGCRKCQYDLIATNKRNGMDTFRQIAQSVHGDRFVYPEQKYKNNKTKLEIVCKKHGPFYQTPDMHIRSKHGCKKCVSETQSHTETIVSAMLAGQMFRTQVRFDGCKDKKKLSFDFYLPDHNVLIECQGVQHYEPIPFFGGEKQFERQKKHDKIKKDFAINNGYNFVEIPYWLTEDEIKAELMKIVNK